MGRNQAKYFSTINDFMIIYAKKIELAEFNKVVLNPEFYKTFDKEDKKGKYKLQNFIRIGGGDENLRINKSNSWYPIYVNHNLKEITLEKKKNYFEVFPISSTGQERTWKLSKNSTETFLDELVAIKKGKDITIYEKYRIEKGQKVPTVWSDKRYNANHNGIRLLEKIIGRKDFSFPKSLYTVLDTIKLITKPNDLIMDFNLNYKSIVKALTPHFLRQEKNLEFLYSGIKALQTINDKLFAFRNEMFFTLAFNSQVIYLEKYLNTVYLTGENITISDGANVTYFYVWNYMYLFFY
jgi:adenine-specific DNA-methyltransferase